MATAAPQMGTDQRFFLRLSAAVSLFIILGFAQFAARGMVDIPNVPVWVHLHAVSAAAWLALFVTQSWLATNGSIALHRRLGWAGVGLVLAILVLGSMAGMRAIALHRQPPFFEPPYFLALTHVGLAFFAGVVGAAIVKRRDTAWHQRLMLVATVFLMEPALGRVLPMPLTGGEAGEWLACLVQLGVIALAMRHDHKHLGAVHPALMWGAGLLIGAHLLVSILSRTGPVIALAQGLAAG